MQTLKDRWGIFKGTILDPFVLIPLVATIGLGILLRSQKESEIIAALTVIISLTSGFLGAILRNKWSEMTEEKVIVTRGKVAVRSLKLLLGNIVTLDKRIGEFLSRCQTPGGNITTDPEVIKTYLEEIIGRCRTQEEEAISSIENWTDIIPEADIKSQIGIISELREKERNLSREVKTLTEAVKDIKNQNKEDKERLMEEIQSKEEELNSTKRLLTKSANEAFGTSGYSGIAGYNLLSTQPLGLAAGVTFFNMPCSKCGRLFTTNNALAAMCPDCSKKSEE